MPEEIRSTENPTAIGVRLPPGDAVLLSQLGRRLNATQAGTIGAALRHFAESVRRDLPIFADTHGLDDPVGVTVFEVGAGGVPTPVALLDDLPYLPRKGERLGINDNPMDVVPSSANMRAYEVIEVTHNARRAETGPRMHRHLPYGVSIFVKPAH